MAFGDFRVAYADDGTESGGEDDSSSTHEDAPSMRVRVGGRGATGAALRGQRLHFSLDQLQQHYHLPLKAAAHELGVCEAALKRICRRNNIKKWPYRQLQSVMRRIEEESHLDLLQYAFQHSESFRDKFSALSSSSGFLLPHEVQDRRKSIMVLEIQLARENHSRTLRIQQLQNEKQSIIDSAHVAMSPRACNVKVNGMDVTNEEDDVESPSIVMVDVIDVDDPLDMLASLCVLELSRGKVPVTTRPQAQAARSKSRRAIRKDGGNDARSVEILSYVMTEPTAHGL